MNLRGGGILVVDWRTMPMSIIGEYEKTHLPVDGGMFGQAKGRVFGTGGGPNQFTVYRLPVNGYASSNPPNTPAPEILLDDNSPDRDAHGVEATKHDRYIWVGDRAGNVVEIFNSETGAHAGTFDLRSEFSSDPTPDLITRSPDRKWFFLSTRGPNPLSGDPHAAQGSDPGMLIVRVKGGGKKGKVEGLVPISNIDLAGIERADGHGIRARSK